MSQDSWSHDELPPPPSSSKLPDSSPKRKRPAHCMGATASLVPPLGSRVTQGQNPLMRGDHGLHSTETIFPTRLLQRLLEPDSWLVLNSRCFFV